MDINLTIVQHKIISYLGNNNVSSIKVSSINVSSTVYYSITWVRLGQTH